MAYCLVSIGSARKSCVEIVFYSPGKKCVDNTALDRILVVLTL